MRSVPKNRAAKYMSIFAQWTLFLTFALLTGLFQPSISFAQGKSSFAPQTPNAVKFTPPPPPKFGDPCKRAWKSVKKRIGKKKIGTEQFSIDPKTLFQNRCNKYKDDLTAWARKPFDDAKSKFDDAKDKALGAPQKAIDKAQKDLADGFYAWAAEQMRQRLPPKERSKYSDINDPATRARFQEWANDPKSEFGAYVGAYMNENHSTLAGAYSTYVDLTSGQSKTIIDGFKGILSDAKAKLTRFTKVSNEIKKDPKAKYKEKLAKAGFGGNWLNKFGKYEGKLRALDRDYDIKEASTIMIEAFQSDVPRDKIRGLFKLMDNMASTAEDSNIPIVSLMGTIVKSYASVATQMLAAVEGLEEILQARAGYCIGVGAPGLENRASNILDKRGITACPLALKRDPWQHIYEGVDGPKGPATGDIFFWTGKKFIDGVRGNGGKGAAQEAVKFAPKAKSVGYKVPKNMKGYAGIYNVPGGITPLLDKSRKVITGIDTTLKKLTRSTFKGGKCSRDKVLDHLKTMTGLDIKSFAKEMEDKGVDRLITTYAASYIAENKGFGKSGRARANAYKTYDDIWAKLKDMSFTFVSGEVRNLNKPTAPCPECAGAILSVRVNSGEEVRSCETWKADNKANFSLYVLSKAPSSSITVSAEIKGAKSDPYPVQGQSVRVLVNSRKEDDKKTAECEAARTKLSNARSNIAKGNVLAAESFLRYAKEHNCPDIADDIAQVQSDIDAKNTANEAMANTAGATCKIEDIETAIAKLGKSPNAKSKTLIARLEKVKTVLNTGGADLEKSKQALRRGKINEAETSLNDLEQKLKNISKFAPCSNLTNALASAREALGRLQQILADADRALQQCSTDGISRMISRLEKMDTKNPAISQKLTSLNRTKGAMDSSRQSYLAAKAAYEAGDSQTALAKLDQADRALDSIGSKNACQNARDRFARARDKARDLANLERAAQSATASCSIPELRRLINKATDKKLPVAEKLKIRLVTIESARDHYQRADAHYRKGNLSSASLSLEKSAEVLGHLEGGSCPSLNNRINSAISGVARLSNNIAGAEQAMTQCKVSELENWQTKLSPKGKNPSVKPVLARLAKTKSRCERKEQERRQRNADLDCTNHNGPGFYASPVLSDGTYGCRPTQATANTWCNQNNQGTGWVATNIKNNGTHGCRLSRRAQQRNAVNYCKKRFGRAFVRVVWLKNGRYNCQYRTAQPRRNTCPQGYYYDANTRRCHSTAAAIGNILQGIQGLTGNRGSRTNARTQCPAGYHYSHDLRRCHRDAAPQRRTPWKCPRHLTTADGRCKIILRNR